MLEFIPHWVLTALVGVIAALFLEKGRERRDLLFIGLAALFAAVWMVSVTMTDYTVQREHQVPRFWLALTIDALLPTLFFIHVALLQLEKNYSPGMQIRRRSWLPLALGLAALTVLHGVDPEFFFRRVRLDAAAGSIRLNPLYALRFSLGLGYFFFLLAAAYVFLGAITRLPKIIAGMQLPEAERRNRALLSLGVLTTFWVAAFDIMPTLFSASAPSQLRLVGPALGATSAACAMVFTGVLDGRTIVRRVLFYSIRILAIAVPAAVLLVRYREPLANLPAQSAGLLAVCAVVAVDFLVLRLKPLLDWLALPNARAVHGTNEPPGCGQGAEVVGETEARTPESEAG